MIFARRERAAQAPNSTCTTTSGGSPCRLTCPASATAGSVCRHCRRQDHDRPWRPPATAGSGHRSSRVRCRRRAVHAATAHGLRRRQRPAPGGNRRGTARSPSRCPLAELPECDSRKTACVTVGSRWHPGTAHRVTGAGQRLPAAAAAGDLPAVSPGPVSRVAAPVTHPAEARVLRRGASAGPAYRAAQQRCPAGRDSTRLAGSQPASERNAGSSRAASRWPGRPAAPRPARGHARPRPPWPPAGSHGRTLRSDVAPACSRGLGTASTAARSRAGSGCRYTCDERH